MIYIIIIIGLCWCLFFSRNPKVGEYIYLINSRIERKLASLHLFRHQQGDNTYIYYSNANKTKPTMLLLHGFSADKDIWLKFAKYAKDDYNLIIPDLLGHGEMPYFSENNYSAFKQATHIEALISDLNIKGEVIIVGNSMGGMISAILAQNYVSCASKPNYTISKISLLDPAGASTNFAKVLAEEGKIPFEHNSSASVFEFFKLSMHSPPFVPPAVLSYIAEEKYLALREQLKHMFIDFFNIDEFFVDPFQLNDMEVQLIWGEFDGLLPLSEAEAWEQLLDKKALVLKDIGHMPMVECPKQTYNYIN